MVAGCNGRYDKIPYYISNGISRMVFDIGGYVVKYEYNSHDLVNKKEVDIYKQGVKLGISHLLAKPIYTSPDYKWLIMEKLAYTVGDAQRNAVDDIEYRKIEREFRVTADKIKQVFPYLWDLDRHKGNIMIDSKGNYKAVDYAW